MNELIQRSARAVDHAAAVMAGLPRGWLGSRTARLGPRPERPFLLYEWEACPFCRKVREALCLLDLDAEVRPCPKRGERFRPEAASRGGKAQFPYFIDPNENGRELYESDQIVAYLFERYGAGVAPVRLRAGAATRISALAVSLIRAVPRRRGTFARPSRAPAVPLELFGHEGSGATRIVREVLCELELPYLARSLASGSRKLTGSAAPLSVPYLIDPSAGFSGQGAAEITAHLERTYAASA